MFRIKIKNLMVFTGLAALLLVAPRSRHHDLFNISMLISLYVFPLYALARIGLPRSGAEMLGFAMSAAYLAWGALYLFRPGHPPYYNAGLPGFLHRMSMTSNALFHPGQPTRYAEVWHFVRRWNWGLMALFYAGLFIDGLVTQLRHRGNEQRDGIRSDRAHRTPFRLVGFALWWIALLWFVGSPWGWPVVVGSTSLAIIAAARRDWRGTSQSTWRLLSEVCRALPAVGIGVGLGLCWTWQGPNFAAFAASLVIIGFVSCRWLVVRWPRLRVTTLLLAVSWPKLRVIAFLLAVYYGFSVSAQIVEMPAPSLFSPVIIIRVKPTFTPQTLTAEPVGDLSPREIK